MDAQRKREFKAALNLGLKELTSEVLRLKVKSLHLDCSIGTETTAQAWIGLEFLSRVDGLYLQANVFGGQLNDCLEALPLPKQANNLLAPGVFFLSTLGEKNGPFCSEQGGARMIYPTMTAEAFANDVMSRIKQHYLPLVEAVLSLSPKLPGYVVKYADSFSYPLTILAILERVGLEPKFSQLVQTKQTKSRFKREHRFDFDSLLSEARLPNL